MLPEVKVHCRDLAARLPGLRGSDCLVSSSGTGGCLGVSFVQDQAPLSTVGEPQPPTSIVPQTWRLAVFLLEVALVCCVGLSEHNDLEVVA